MHFGINWSFLGLELPAKMSGRKNNGLIIEFDFSKVKNEMKIQNQSNLYLAVSIIFLQGELQASVLCSVNKITILIQECNSFGSKTMGSTMDFCHLTCFNVFWTGCPALNFDEITFLKSFDKSAPNRWIRSLPRCPQSYHQIRI